MTVHDQAISKIHQLPESLARQVNEFIDSLLRKPNDFPGQSSDQLSEAQMLAESDIGDYARELADYEDRLARGEIRW